MNFLKKSVIKTYHDKQLKLSPPRKWAFPLNMKLISLPFQKRFSVMRFAGNISMYKKLLTEKKSREKPSLMI